MLDIVRLGFANNELTDSHKKRYIRIDQVRLQPVEGLSQPTVLATVAMAKHFPLLSTVMKKKKQQLPHCFCFQQHGCYDPVVDCLSIFSI